MVASDLHEIYDGAMHSRLGLWFRVALLAVSVPGAPGCSTKDAAKCQQAQSTVRQALKLADFTSAKQWREYAWKQCEDASQLQALDQEIVARQSEVEQQRAQAEKKKNDTQELVKLFVGYVGEHRGAVERASAGVSCEEPAGAPKPAPASLERWCSASRAVGSEYSIQLRYWDADRQAFRFITRPGGVVTCADLGPHAVRRSWQVAATGGRSTTRTHCEFTGGPLAGLQGVVSEAERAEVQVFSAKYLEKDPALRGMLGG